MQVGTCTQEKIFIFISFILVFSYFGIFLCIRINLEDNASREGANEVGNQDGYDDEGHVALSSVLLLLLVDVLEVEIIQTALLPFYHMDIYTSPPIKFRKHKTLFVKINQTSFLFTLSFCSKACIILRMVLFQQNTIQDSDQIVKVSRIKSIIYQKDSAHQRLCSKDVLLFKINAKMSSYSVPLQKAVGSKQCQ